MAGISPTNTIERRVLNDEIEETYISATQASANCQTAVANGKGNYYALYRDFYQYFYHLFDLTRDIKEVTDKESKLCENITQWFLGQKNIVTKPQAEVIKLISEGNDWFRQYKKVLSTSGVISLPTRSK